MTYSDLAAIGTRGHPVLSPWLYTLVICKVIMKMMCTYIDSPDHPTGLGFCSYWLHLIPTRWCPSANYHTKGTHGKSHLFLEKMNKPLWSVIMDDSAPTHKRKILKRKYSPPGKKTDCWSVHKDYFQIKLLLRENDNVSLNSIFRYSQACYLCKSTSLSL